MVLAFAISLVGACAREPITKDNETHAEYKTAFVLRGTEPFWMLEMTPGQAFVLTFPDGAPHREPYMEPRIDGESARFESGDMAIMLTRGACSDGMSDIQYPYIAEVVARSVTLRGCAQRK
jgi:uncharacterized membrane protein